MGYASRDFAGAVDLDPITALARDCLPMTPHTVDLPWRLGSTALDDPANARLWERNGDLVGLAVWQQPWACLDLIVAQEADQDLLMDAILKWAGGRFAELDCERGFPLPYWVDVHEHDHERRHRLEARGFTLDGRQADVILSCSVDRPGQIPALPPEFTIRPIQGEDIEAYVVAHRAAFGSESMTAAWRARTLASPGHVPSLDLIVAGPDGTVAGFCVGWLSGDGQTGHIEPMGVLPTCRRLGLATVLLAEILTRFRSCGARTVTVQTETDRAPAIGAYRRAGFAPTGRLLKRGRQFSSGVGT